MPGVNLINSCETCTRRWKNFQHLTKSELQTINENRYEATFNPGEIMLKQGSPTSNALFMSSGMAKTYIEGINGKNFIMGIALPGRLIMGPGAYVNSRHTYSVSAITTVHACFISFDIFRQLVRVNGAFAESLIEDISLPGKAILITKFFPLSPSIYVFAIPVAINKAFDVGEPCLIIISPGLNVASYLFSFTRSSSSFVRC